MKKNEENEFIGIESEFNKMDSMLRDNAMKSGAWLCITYDCSDENNKIEELKTLVTEYRHDINNPKLPKEPNGSLFGIGFIYDNDEDDRVLVAIDKLKHLKGIIAVSEHEGVIYIYSNYIHEIDSIELCGDTWSAFEFLFKNGEWVEI